MELLEAGQRGFTFQFSGREKKLFLQILNLYPLLPSGYHRRTRSNKPSDAMDTDQLLEEALAEQRQANKQLLEAMIADPKRFRAVGGGHRFFIEVPQLEWLLQVLNDVRIGSWLRVGSPDPAKRKRPRLDEESAPYFVAMEMSGYFQSAFLEALSGEG